ncbi:MAG: MerR family transcriptional regulator [Gemmatimonadota bacterium]|nr:MerR family transcriptional regulator [Gemmatimonadota bacterium]
MNRHPIRVAALRAGLSPAALRAWERRYAAVVPERTEAGQRMYTDAQVRRLELLRRATEAGRAIHQIAGLTDEALEVLVAGDVLPPIPGAQVQAPTPPRTAQETVERAFAAVEGLDGARLERVLRRAALARGLQGVAEQVFHPLSVRIGEAWAAGTLGPAHEHLASATLRRILSWMIDAAQPSDGRGPTIVVATPTGERHEIGAMIVGATAAQEGWQVVYLGPDLPAPDLADAAVRVGARVVAVSLVRADATSMPYLLALRGALPEGTELVVGGGAAGGTTMLPTGTTHAPDLDTFRARLAQWARRPD